MAERTRNLPTGPDHPNWKGGEFFATRLGRWMVSRDGRRLQRSRAVIEDDIGRELRSDEHVHHINGDKTDDRIENLELLTAEEHRRRHSPLRTQGVVLAHRMLAAGFTRAEIAAHLGVDRSSVSRLFTGNRQPKIWKDAA